MIVTIEVDSLHTGNWSYNILTTVRLRNKIIYTESVLAANNQNHVCSLSHDDWECK